MKLTAARAFSGRFVRCSVRGEGCREVNCELMFTCEAFCGAACSFVWVSVVDVLMVLVVDIFENVIWAPPATLALCSWLFQGRSGA